jgi:hypothetical protein
METTMKRIAFALVILTRFGCAQDPGVGTVDGDDDPTTSTPASEPDVNQTYESVVVELTPQGAVERSRTRISVAAQRAQADALLAPAAPGVHQSALTVATSGGPGDALRLWDQPNFAGNQLVIYGDQAVKVGSSGDVDLDLRPRTVCVSNPFPWCFQLTWAHAIRSLSTGNHGGIFIRGIASTENGTAFDFGWSAPTAPPDAQNASYLAFVYHRFNP